jgi:hypothetical protein
MPADHVTPEQAPDPGGHLAGTAQGRPAAACRGTSSPAGPAR